MSGHVSRTASTCLAISIAVLAGLAADAPALPPEEPRSVATADSVGYRGVPIGRIWCQGNSRTHDDVIIRELLVRPADAFTPELIQESERNLRRFSYIGSAEIIPHHDPVRNVVDLEVRVTDRFPWVVFPSPSFGGGRFDLSFVVANLNVVGRGQTAGIQGEVSSDEADTYIAVFQEPRLGGSRWGGSMVGGRQGDRGEQLRMEVGRPLYSLSTRWAYGFSVFDWEVQRSLYRGGNKVSQYYNRQLGASAYATRSIRSKDRRLEITVSHVYFDEQNEHDEGWSGLISGDKQRATVRVRVGAERFRYVEDTYLFQMGPVEDVKLGPRGAIRFGAALEVLGSDRSYPELGAGVGWFGKPAKRAYAHFSVDSDARLVDGDITHHTGSATAGLLWRVGSRNLLSGRVEGRFLNEMEDPTQLLLGSGRGLRGFPAQAFDGSRLLNLSVEWRQTVWVTSRVAMAYVVFTDAGSTWDSGQSIDDVPFLVGSGTGLRLSFPGLIGGPILRLDFAHGFRDDYFDVSVGL